MVRNLGRIQCLDVDNYFTFGGIVTFKAFEINIYIHEML